MYEHGEITLAEIMFHELAHQQFYIKGNSAFNEAFATVVGEQGALAWIRAYRPDKESDYLQLIQVRNDFSELIQNAKVELQQVYALNLSNDIKRHKKESILLQMRKDYEQLKSSKWQGKAFYGRWFDKPINNARLAAFSTYRELVPKFEALLKLCGNDFELFYKTIQFQKVLAKKGEVPSQCLA